MVPLHQPPVHLSRYRRSVRHFEGAKKAEKCLTLLGGQSVIEYAVLIAVVVAALAAMAVYTKRALNGRWRGVGDAFGHGRQYEPGVTREL